MGSVEVPSCSYSLALRMAWPEGDPGCSCWVAGPGEASLSTLGGVSMLGDGRRGLGARDTCWRPRGIVGELFRFHRKEADWVSISSRLFIPRWLGHQGILIAPHMATLA